MAKELAKKGMKTTGNWFMEAYDKERFETPDAEGNIIVDFYVECKTAADTPKATEKDESFVEQSRTEIVAIADDIKVVGLSLAATGWDKKLDNIGEKIGNLWGVYSDEHRRKTNAKLPVTGYGFWVMKDGGDYDYIVGSEVVEFGEVAQGLVSATIPAGRYIKDSFNAETFSKLVEDALHKRHGAPEKWAAENGVKIVDPHALFVAGVEVYPVQEMVKPQGEVTNENFKRDDRLTAKHPWMHTLTRIE